MMIFHDSRSGVYRIPTGAAECSGVVQLRIRARQVQRVWLRTWWDEAETLYEMRPVGQDMYAYALKMPKTPGLLWYYFRIEDGNGHRWYFGNAADGLGGVGELTDTEPKSYQITVCKRGYVTPEWMRNGAMMQIMVDRFYASEKPDVNRLPAGSFYHTRWDDDPLLVVNDRSGEYCANDFFGGDLKGIEEKLDYIEELGVTVLYLNPIFKANSNHKYNTGDYMQIDPAFGTEEDFQSLCSAAQTRGIRVILDGVFSHTGSDSIYFNKNGNYGEGGAYNDLTSPYSSWYSFKDWPDDYESWWGIKTLPAVNELEPSYLDYIIDAEDSVVAHWMKAGASGWRLDVADELPMEFLQALRKREKEIDPDAVLIGEVWEDPSNKIAYGKMRSYCLGDTLDSTMNYPLRDAVLLFMRCRIDAVNFVRRVEAMAENLPKQFFYAEMNLLGSHDKPRALTVLAEIGDMEPDRRFRRAFDMAPTDYARGKRRLIAAWQLICALPGIPCVYYGDEAGLYGMGDPFCRGTYPWGHEDAELVDAFRDALQRRAKSPALRTGGLKLTACGQDVVLVRREITRGHDVFGKSAKNESCVLAVNRAAERRWVEYDGCTIEVPAQSAVWLECKRKKNQDRVKK